MLRIWLDRGIDGFRVDVAHGMVKAAGLPDSDGQGRRQPARVEPARRSTTSSRAGAASSTATTGELILVGEAWSAGGKPPDYAGPTTLQVFYFDLVAAVRLGSPSAGRSTRASGRWRGPRVATWTLNNHDVHRSVDPLGRSTGADASADPHAARRSARVDLALGTRRARAALLLVLACPAPCTSTRARSSAARGARPPRRPPGPDWAVPWRRARPRRLPGAVALGRRGARFRLQQRYVCMLISQQSAATSAPNSCMSAVLLTTFTLYRPCHALFPRLSSSRR